MVRPLYHPHESKDEIQRMQSVASYAITSVKIFVVLGAIGVIFWDPVKTLAVAVVVAILLAVGGSFISGYVMGR